MVINLVPYPMALPIAEDKWRYNDMDDSRHILTWLLFESLDLETFGIALSYNVM